MVLKGEAIMTFNKAQKGSDYGREETLHHKTPSEECFHKIYDLNNGMEQKMYTD